MTNYELEYSKFLADMTEQVADFIQSAYLSNNNIYDTKNNQEIQTEMIEDNNYENVDNTKVELIDYGQLQNPQTDIKKTLIWIAGIIIVYKLLKR